MKMIRLATTPAAFNQLPASWFKTLWTPDVPMTRLTLALLARVCNGRLGEGSCWIQSADLEPNPRRHRPAPLAEPKPQLVIHTRMDDEAPKRRNGQAHSSKVDPVESDVTSQRTKPTKICLVQLASLEDATPSACQVLRHARAVGMPSQSVV